MPYSSGTASSLENLMTQFNTFCVTNGWTNDELDLVNDRLGLHRGSVYVQFHWDNTDDIGFWQSTGFTPAATPGNHPGDCGNTASGTGAITTGRRIQMRSNGPFLSHHFFAPSSAPYYAYCAVEIASGVYRFFGMGTINKINDWTGGEFCFGTGWFGGLNVPRIDQHTTGFDAGNGAGGEAYASHMRIEGLPGMNASSKWGLFTNGTTLGNDTAGNPRYNLIGGGRGGVYANALGWFPLGNIQNMLPLIPIPVFYWRIPTTPDLFYLLGHKPDFRQVNITNFDPGQEVTVGSDTWIMFPMNAKVFNTGLAVDQSGNGGFAIKKIT